MPEKRAHSPEIDGETRSTHRRLEKPLLAPTVFEEFKWTCAAFRVKTDPNIYPNTFPALEPNPYDKHLAKPLQLLKLTLDFDKIEEFNKLCFRSQHWRSVPSDAVQCLHGSVGYVVDTKPTNENAVSCSAQRIIGDCLHLANLLLHGGSKTAYVAAVPESTFSIRTIETGAERQQRDHLRWSAEKSFYLVAVQSEGDTRGWNCCITS
ncbi:uncharacterized protein EV420DRAFT_282151 [Desarmillaria tabescens]|uniref:Uncharacterized protein n=1 Tax=Armillaria tabescens TaxID=1929756 RepID=A0AA39KEG4_ARMTA|nr:uncharacterized protein EV420DRAFT_282151 [Desarmillaria tabescens]KAK0459667.1 hypothetical protein EV420DRAFT_282151 [Desarmillaria tabescens]